MLLKIIRADPAGNITVFVMNPPPAAGERLKAARLILDDPHLKAEQVGFVYPPETPGRRWRLEMMGAEFCGNASRSFGLLVAAQSGLSGKHTLMIETSGMKAPVPVCIDTTAKTAGIELPSEFFETEITHEGRNYPVYTFSGITHIIAENVIPNEQLARSLIRLLGNCAAAGVMFFDTGAKYLQPAVWVRATDTMIFESSCGSGSAALGVWIARNDRDARLALGINQSGGTIIVTVVKQAGKIKKLSISGKVTLGKPETLTFNGEIL